MAATNKKANKASSAATRASGVAAKRTKRVATKRTKRAVPRREGKTIVQLRRFKAAKPTEESPLPEPIATFTF